MGTLAKAATETLRRMLTDADGLPLAISEIAALEGVELAPIAAEQVAAQNVAFEVAERSAGVKYPAVYVFCEGLANVLKEKFRTFSGRAHMAVEVRITHDRLEGLGYHLQLYAGAVTAVLDSKRGDWGGGMFCAGTYKVEFGPVKRGGRNFLQTAKISFEVEVSK